jgi:cytochrome P450
LSVNGYYVPRSEKLFPDPETFIPERWLNNPRTIDGRLLTPYLTAFSKGTRICYGVQLGYCELYIVLATLVRRVDMEILTMEEEMLPYSENIILIPKDIGRR